VTVRIGAVLSLTGRFAQFGTQAGHALTAWSQLSPDVEIIIEDDGGEPDRVRTGLRSLQGRCDLLLGPYSTVLTRAAGEFARDAGVLLWNHGGSGDDVQGANPGHLVSVLSPTSSYAESFVQYIAELPTRAPLLLVEGRGSFGRQVIAGAAATAGRLGVSTVHGKVEELPGNGQWDLFTAGTFEHDVEVLASVSRLAARPRTAGSVAAGVQGFAEVAVSTEGIFGTAQWVPGIGGPVQLGPTEADFISVYRRVAGTPPDYPAVQVAAAASIARHCLEVAGGSSRRDLFAVATALRTATLFGTYAIDPESGQQRGHRMALVRWSAGRMTPA
jgi:ABC-type branched-subunit amino acid transport system substrate-binding protein